MLVAGALAPKVMDNPLDLYNDPATKCQERHGECDLADPSANTSQYNHISLPSL